MNDELYHHGILGMRWGIRRYQNRDGTLTPEGRKRYADAPKAVKQSDYIKNDDGSYTIPKDHAFYRVGNKEIDVNESGGLYVSDASSNDVHRYIKSLGPTKIGELLGIAAHNVQTISAVDNIKLASDDQHNKAVLDILANDKGLFNSWKKSMYSMVVDDYEHISQDTIRKLSKNPNQRIAKQVAYSISSLYGDPNHASETSKFYDAFKRQGFDAIPDVHDKMSGTSETPMIILNHSKVKQTNTQYITKEVMENGKRMVRNLGKLPVDDAI